MAVEYFDDRFRPVVDEKKADAAVVTKKVVSADAAVVAGAEVATK